MLPFKKGAFHLALQAKVPIVPIVIANYSHVLNVKAMTFEKGSIPVRGKILRMFNIAIMLSL
jgi:lysophosphatidate acyltransferase